MLQQDHLVYAFADFHLDVSERLLLHQGRPLQLTPKIFETLVILVQNSGRLVEKETFIRQLWPNTFVEDAALAQNISQLRRILGDKGNGSTMIQTLPKKGYRFAVPVRVLAAGVSKPDAVPAPTSAGLKLGATSWSLRTHPISRGFFVLGGLVLLGLATLSFQWINTPGGVRVLHVAQLTTTGRAEPWGGLHVDGARLYFNERSGSSWQLMQTPVSGGEISAAPAPFPYTRLFGLSPDQSQVLIGEASPPSSTVQLWTVPPTGGAPRRLADTKVSDAAWFPDGTRILCSSGKEIFSVAADGSDRRHLFNVPGRAQGFVWRPESNSFRFTLYDSNDGSSLWEATPDALAAHPLLPGWNPSFNDCCGVWTPDGKQFLFSSARNGRGEIWSLAVDNSLFHWRNPQPVPITSGPTDLTAAAISRDGRHLYAFGSAYNGSVFRFDGAQHGFTPFMNSLIAIDLAYSRDGRWLVYIGSGGSLWRSRADGSARQELIAGSMRALRPRWSRDGRQILFLGQLPHSNYTAYIISVDGGTPQPILNNDTAYRGFADWSPDGQSVVVDELPAGDNPRAGLTQVDLATHKGSVLPGSEGKYNARWSPDGRFLAASSQDTNTLFIYDPRLQRWTSAATAKSISRIEWSSDSRYIYYQDSLDPAESVFRVSIEDKKPPQLALSFAQPISAGAIRCGFEGLAPDGSYLASIRSNYANLYVLDIDSH